MRTSELEGVRSPADPLTQAAKEHPGGGGTWHVLPHRDRRPHRLGLNRREVEILAYVVLVSPHRPVRSEGDVLRVKDVDVYGIRSAVGHLDVPEPGRHGGGQTKSHPVLQIAPSACHYETFCGPLQAAGRPARWCPSNYASLAYRQGNRA